MLKKKDIWRDQADYKFLYPPNLVFLQFDSNPGTNVKKKMVKNAPTTDQEGVEEMSILKRTDTTKGKMITQKDRIKIWNNLIIKFSKIFQQQKQKLQCHYSFWLKVFLECFLLLHYFLFFTKIFLSESTLCDIYIEYI